MYNQMPINRQIDEYLVRVIQGKIYEKVNGKDYVFNKLLYKEIKYGGFDNLETLFNYMKYYDYNRYKYKKIVDYLPRLVNKTLNWIKCVQNDRFSFSAIWMIKIIPSVTDT